MTGQTLPDRRALAFPDEPFSAYCKVCWQCVYPLWMDKNDHHGGACMFGHENATDCQHAMEWERCMGAIRKYRNASASADRPSAVNLDPSDDKVGQ